VTVEPLLMRGKPDYLPGAKWLHSSVEVRGAEPGSPRPATPPRRAVSARGVCVSAVAPGLSHRPSAPP